MLAGNAATGGEQSEINTLKIKFGQVPDTVGLAAKGHGLAHRTLARQRNQLTDRKFSFLQDLEDGLTDEASGSDDSNAISILARHTINTLRFVARNGV
jgi:hypothetical protein